ncbi:unnamed protein product [Cuscuta epithymum]|uniref:Uncharacterized protein n=1 Tax=Cuscuta epithymum TaxID=186058 RepID=A0AAV0FZY2_9ASTE|nr:unnamed protein product [Cuscuta epithymum]
MNLQLNHTFSSPSSPFYYSQTLLVLAPLKIRCSLRSPEPGSAPEVSVSKLTSEAPIPLRARKFVRSVRRDAEAALFDYLHCTRGFSYLDSELISRNSPRFLRYLVSKIRRDEKDVAGALTRFFRYHPINEFEPFFESLGLGRYDVACLLPDNMMFLTDDTTLLDNYHVLFDYGVPHTKIGKIFKEAGEVFRYGYGVLNMKLRDFENLGLCQSTVIDLVICCPNLLLPGKKDEFIVVLDKLKDIGFESDWIVSCLSSKQTYNWRRVLDTTCFLSEISYSNPQMITLVKANPALLFEGTQAYLLVTQLVKLGLSRNTIYLWFTENPKILTLNHAKRICKAIKFLLEIGMDRENIARTVSTNIQVIGKYPLKYPNFVLKDFKGDRARLSKIIQKDPMNLLRLASNWETKSLWKRTELSNLKLKKAFLLRLGYVKNSDEMKKVFKSVEARGDLLQERFDCLVEAGLDRNDVVQMFRRTPKMLNGTKEEILKKIEILKKYSSFGVESIVRFPTFLTYGNYRIKCRLSMYEWGKERGVLRPTLTLSTILVSTEGRFLKYYVNVHPYGPAMWESLKIRFLSS